MIQFRQTAVGLMLAGNAFWFAVHIDGTTPTPPEFDPPNRVGVIESFRQDGPGDHWRWTGALAGGGAIVRLNRGQEVEIFVPGQLGGPALHVGAWSPGDWNFDSVVNSTDISRFLSDWVESVGQNSNNDFNLDGRVDSGDISAFLTAWVSR